MDIDVRKYIKDIEKQYAHIQNWKQPETLEEHLNTTIKYYEKLNKEKQMNEKVKKIIEDVCSFDGITEKEEEIIYQLFFYAIYLHDIGKINPKFQKDKMNNPWIKNVNNSSSEHSLPSSLIYIDIFSEKIEPLKNKRFLYVILYSFAYIISRHHSNLDDLEGEEFLSRLKKVKESGIYESYLYKERLMNINLDDNIYMNKNKLLNRYEVPEIAYYILNKMLYSLIVTCDYYATYEYMNSSDIDIEIIKDTDKFIEKYENTEIYQNIEKYRKDKTLLEENNINRLRSDIFIETEENLLKNLDKNIFYLEAPTGSGKTNTSINLALKILQNKREINNIFYIFPFNTLVEQTKKTLEKVFDYEKDFMCINSITPITQKTEENLDYNKIYLNYQFMNYPIILTSHVNMFSSFFGVKRENHLFLSRFVNSVIIIDEVQAYKNSIWKEIIIFLNQYAKYFNIKIIIMSATLPKLNRLIDEENEKSVDLITKKDNYFRNPLFRNRVKIDESLLEKEKLTLEELERFIIELSKLKKKIIIEFIKKKTAREFYKLLKEEIKDTEIVEISGDDNHYTRNLILEKIQNKTNIVVVCTQVIEAGVDIDMDIGLKDISLLELEEQFLGRINRSCKKQGCVTYFFNYDKASDIYREDLRTQYDIREKRYFNLLQEKSFDLYYQQILEKINQRSEERNRNNIEGMLESIRHLHFSVINQKMKLIEKNNVQIFLAHNMKINNEIIDGKKVWEGYKEICDNQELEYAEKQIKLSTIMGVMELFLYSIEIYDKESQKLYFTEEMGNILYIEEGEEFLDEGKFDREKYFKKCGEIFW